jgi:hypothetical protein
MLNFELIKKSGLTHIIRTIKMFNDNHNYSD